ncbi:chromate efflux transporter [Taibaiella chishuiensis]|uniref:Chromate transporter n=1 Tax=Taibaiella chishuiensis TaxID=1434707 RepID=A0A2P8CWW9_9BACT|nr:chromate efflux transporter [Taibaiella chishuiensis]PSK89461.1 chromate transporter [Taibaiella chishuiensis]
MDSTESIQKLNERQTTAPSFSEALRFWFILGWISFGGTTGHITIMHDFLVLKKRWISNRKFYHALNACMILPGPEAHQLSIFLGWKLHGVKGGIVSGIFFILPSIAILTGLSIIYAIYGNTPLLGSIFNGLKPAVLGIIIYATWKVGRQALTSPAHYCAAIAAFVLSYFAGVPMPWIILGTIVFGILLSFVPVKYSGLKNSKRKTAESAEPEDLYYINSDQPLQKQPSRTLVKYAVVFLLLWLVPFVILICCSADAAFWQKTSLLFTRAAFLTIGGSYTVIPYVAGLVTTKLMWLSKTQMIDGFALAETTPGPLVVVLSYVGFMAAFNHFHGSLLMGTLGLLVASYFTFLPNFILIFMGAGFIEKTQDYPVIQTVLSLITATVVGVIVNLACYLGGAILFGQQGAGLFAIDWVSLAWVVFSFILLARYRINMLYLILLSILFGLLRFGIEM